MPGLHRTAQREHTLSAAVRAALVAAPRPSGAPVFASVHGGLSRLVDAVAAGSRALVRLDTTVRELVASATGWHVVVGPRTEPEQLDADAVVLALPAAAAMRLLATADIPGLDLAYASVALVTAAFPPGTALPELSGFLVPAVQGYAVKAATFVSTKWTHLGGADRPVLVRMSLGRAGEEAVLQHPDPALAQLALAELPDLIGSALPAPLASAVHRWGGGLPQYGVGHADRVAALRAAMPRRLALAGAAFDGVGIAACVRSGQAAAQTLWAELGE
jgi:oxygen-dependent protoporphyrinogen oxidase